MQPLENLFDGDYNNIGQAGGVTWLYHNDTTYSFDEVTISGNAHVAILSNTSSTNVVISADILKGDRSGVLHAGKRQTFKFRDINVYLPLNIRAYKVSKFLTIF